MWWFLFLLFSMCCGGGAGLVLVVLDRVSLCSLSSHYIEFRGPSALASWVLGLEVCATKAPFVCFFLWVGERGWHYFLNCSFSLCLKKKVTCQAVVGHAFNPALGVRGRLVSVSLRPGYRVPGQPGLFHKETVSQKTKNQKQPKWKEKE